MSKIEKIKLSDSFDEWRNKINNSLDVISNTNERVETLGEFPLIPEGSQLGLILTNDSENKPNWRDAELLFKELGITLEKDESTGEDISGTSITANKISTSSFSCSGTLTTNYITVNKNISCKGNISTTTGTISGNTISGKKLVSNTSLDGQGINLSYTKPSYIKFFFNKATSVTSSITENKTGTLTINGNEFSSSGSVIYSDLKLRTSKNDVIFKNDDSSFSIKFAGIGEDENSLNPFSIKLSSGVVTLGNGIYSDLRILPTSSTENKSLIIRNKENKAYILISDSLTGNPNSLSPFSIDMTNGNVSIEHLNISGSLTAEVSINTKGQINSSDIATQTLDVSNTATLKTAYVETLQTTYNGSVVDILKNGKIYNSVFNDYAEFFEKGEETEVGDIIALDTDSKEERYIKATNPRTVVGVHSDTYGHILGGLESIENSEESFIPVGMSGRVKTKIIGPIEKGDEVVLSKYPGIGRKYHELTDRERDIIGFAVETNLSEDIKLVRIKI